MATQPWRTELQETLKSLNEDEVRLVCFDLGLDYERLKGPAKVERVADLIAFCEQRKLVLQLQSAIRSRKPAAKLSADVDDVGRRAKVEIALKLDILAFGDRKRNDLLQAMAEQFGIELGEMHVLVEAAKSTRLVLGLPGLDADKLVSACAHKDAHFQSLRQEFDVQRISLLGSEPVGPEKLANWRSRRFRATMRLLLHLAGFPIMLLSGLALARLRVGADVFTMIMAVLQHDPGKILGSVILWTAVGALPGIIAWVAVLVILAQFMQKVYAVGSFWETFEYMFLCVFGLLPSQYPLVYVQEGKVSAKSQSLLQGRPDGPGGPCRYVVLSDSAIVVERGGRRIAVVGPSVHVAGRFEKVQQVIDLRPQTRETTAAVITRDGIPVKVQVGATFRIRWRGEPTAKAPYPADPDALLQAAAAQPVFQAEGGTPDLRNWADRVGNNLDSTLRAIVARYRLDELIEPRDPGARPRSDLERNYAEDLKKTANGMGAEITEVRLGAFEVDIADLAVKRQWMDTWQAWWEGQARVRKARAEAGAFRAREMAQAYAQLEMIAAVSREFQSLGGDESLPIDLITLRFIEVIRRMAANPDSAIFLPHEALQTLDGVRKMLQTAKGAPSSLEPPDVHPRLE